MIVRLFTTDTHNGMTFGEMEGLMAYPVKQVDNFYKQMVELICDSALVYDRAVSRLSGIRI